MAYPNTLTKDISKVLEYKSLGMTTKLIHKENADFFEEILGKDVFYPESGISDILELNKIPAKNLIILQEYLDYLNMIEG